MCTLFVLDTGSFRIPLCMHFISPVFWTTGRSSVNICYTREINTALALRVSLFKSRGSVTVLQPSHALSDSANRQIQPRASLPPSRQPVSWSRACEYFNEPIYPATCRQ